MPITTVSVPADARALTTPARVKAELGAVGRTTPQLTILISRATSILEKWCGRTFARETVVEQWYATVLREAYLERVPVVSIASVTIGGVAVDPATYSVLDAAAGRVHFELFPFGLVPPGGGIADAAYDYAGTGGGGRVYGYRTPLDQAVAVTYTGGWVTPAWTTSDTVDLPDDLQGACVLTVQAMIERTNRESDVASIRLGDAAFSYQTPPPRDGANAVITAEIQAMVAPYRRIAL